MIVEQLVPANGSQELATVLSGLRAGTGVAQPFADGTIAFFTEVSRRLGSSSSTAAMPDVRALAFWMRRSHLVSLKSQFEALSTPGTVRQPRGMVFHLPPANVDTIFMYSWLLSALSGNQNVVRLPQSRGPAITTMCETLNDVLAISEFGRLVPAVTVVGYGHDAATTEAISAEADMRVVWGGNATVRRIREIPLPPRAVELTFADRYSLAAINAQAYLEAGSRKREQLVEDFVSDTFPFDQGACSSPQLIAWCGSADEVTRASDAFFQQVAEAACRRGYVVDAGTATAQTLAAANLAADHAVHSCRRYGRELFVVTLDGPQEIDRNHVGGGFLLSLRLGALSELVPFLTRADQTLTQFGFGEDELVDFARRAAGSGGIDRIVAFGQALTFDRFWDGYDLLDAFTRTVRVTADLGSARAGLAGDPRPAALIDATTQDGVQ
jgi:hypothetical protein